MNIARLIRGVAILAATVAVMMGSATSAAAQAGPTGPPMECPYGLPLHLTLEQALVRYEGYYTEAQILAGFDRNDQTDNGYYCYREDVDGHPLYPTVVFFPLDDFEGDNPG